MTNSDLSPSEAVFAFAGWLTSSEPAVTMGACHEAATPAELVAAFCKSQGFAEPRDGWHKRIKPYPARGIEADARRAGAQSPVPQGTRQDQSGLSAAAPWSKPMSVQETWAAAPAVELKRPDCFEFAMDFLGCPEDDEVRAYVEALESALATHREHPAAQQELADMEARKDAAYEERNRCVALIARMAIALGFKAGVTRTAIEGWPEDWHGCVYVELPTGQASWHFHDSQAYLFEGLPSYEGKWDGHTTPQKYERVGAAFSPAAQQERQAPQAAAAVPLSESDIEAIAHRKAWRYRKSSDPHHSDTYTFNRSCLIDFVRALGITPPEGASE